MAGLWRGVQVDGGLVKHQNRMLSRNEQVKVFKSDRCGMNFRTKRAIKNHG